MFRWISSLAFTFLFFMPISAQVSAEYAKEIYAAEELMEAKNFDEALVRLYRAIDLNPQAANAYSDLGIVFFRLKKIDDALTNFKKSYELDPWNPNVLHSLAIVYSVKKDFLPALDKFEQTYELNPEIPNLKENLTRLYQQLNQPERSDRFFARTAQPTSKQLYFKARVAFFSARNFPLAEEHLRKAVELEPNFIEAKMLLAAALVEERKLSAAATILEELKQQRELSAEALLTLARIYRTLKSVPELIATYEKLLLHVSDHLEAHEELGDAYFKANKFDMAAPHLEKAIEIAPAAQRSYLTLAEVYIAQKRKQEGYILFRKVLALAPNDFKNHQAIGYYLFGEGQFQESISILKRALELEPNNKDVQATLKSVTQAAANAPNLKELKSEVAKNPNNPQAQYRLATEYNFSGNQDEAFPHYLAAYKLDPNNFDVMLYYSFALGHRKDYEEALKVIQKYYDSKPDSMEKNFYQAALYQDLKRYPEAITHFRKVLEFKPKQMVRSGRLATCYESIEDWEKAQETLEKLLKLKPEHVQGLNELAILYFNKNRVPEAMELVERLKKINPRSGGKIADEDAGEINSKPSIHCNPRSESPSRVQRRVRTILSPLGTRD